MRTAILVASLIIADSIRKNPWNHTDTKTIVIALAFVVTLDVIDLIK
jgi:hypothetical protein